jgi:hypothetical protein
MEGVSPLHASGRLNLDEDTPLIQPSALHFFALR